MKRWKGFRSVFCFTFVQKIKAKGFRTATVLVALLCLVVPAAVMAMAEMLGDAEAEREMVSGAVKTVYVADMTGENAVSYNLLNMAGVEGFTDITYVDCKGDPEEAAERAGEDNTALILLVQTQEGNPQIQLSVLLPDHTSLTEEDADGFEAFLQNGYYLILMSRSGLSAGQLAGLLAPVRTQIKAAESGLQGTADIQNTGDGEEDTECTEESGSGIVKRILGILLPFVNIMVLYFLVLIYGQGVAGNVIAEKTSRLMDTFLVSVRPDAMIFGKVFAMVLASILQFTVWMVSLAGGFAVGTFLVRAVNPDSTMELLVFFDSLDLFSGMFSVQGIAAAVMMVFAGFLLYCSLAAIGGAIASKPEDLSSTNVLFTMILVISFFCTLYAGGIEEIGIGSASGGAWLNWVPFTSIMVTPSRILLGDVSLLTGIGSLSVVILTSVLLLALAGRIYKMMSLFKGNPPGIRKIISMLRQKN